MAVIPINQPRSLAAFALRYARLGWYVLPLQPRTKKPLSRLVPNGQDNATTDEETIARWWQAEPEANIGIFMAPSGLVAVDIDPRNGGFETMLELEDKYGPMQSNVWAFTGGGGEHRVFKIPQGFSSTLPSKLGDGKGVDLKVNGYICVEPSVHPSGLTYEWEASSSPLDGNVPDPLPDWVRDLGRGAPPSADKYRPQSSQPVIVSIQVLEDLRLALDTLSSDDRAYWIKIGQSLKELGEQGFELWEAWSGKSAKCKPRELRYNWSTLRPHSLHYQTVFFEAQAKGWKNPMKGEKPAMPAAIADDLPLVFAEDIKADSVNIRQLVEDVLTVPGLSVMYGESNSGKSFLATHMACAIGRGAVWLGKRTVQGAVLYVAGEGAESIKLRVLANRQHYKASTNVAIVPVAINMLDHSADSERVIRAAQIVSTRYKMPVCMIIIDTLARAFAGGNENASEDMGAVISHADKIKEATGAHVMFIHHAGKDTAKGSRGHSSLRAATDTEIEVTAAEDKLHVAEVKKQRDLGSLGDKLTGRFIVKNMGTDKQWNKPITTCVVEDTTEIAVPKKTAAGLKRDGALAMSITAILNDQDLYMRKSELVSKLEPLGYSRTSIYNCLTRLKDADTVTESAGAVKLRAANVSL